MTETTRDETTGERYITIGPDAPDLERYVAISLEGEEVILFDGEVTEAWVQSDVVLSLDEVA